MRAKNRRKYMTNNIPRYLNSFLQHLTTTTPAKKSKPAPEFPDIFWDEEFGDIKFVECDDGASEFIRDCQKHGYNKDTVFKRSITIEGISGVISAIRNEKYGDKIHVDRKGQIYEAIEPLSTEENQPYEIGDIVEGNYYDQSKIMKYEGSGFYEIQSKSGDKQKVHINSMRTPKVKEPTVNSIGSSTIPKSQKLAEEIRQWAVQSGWTATPVEAGESKTGKVYFATGFLFPRAFKGVIQVYGPKFIAIKYEFRGNTCKEIAKSPEEFHDIMQEKFGAFIME